MLVALNLGLMGFSALEPFAFSFDPGFLAKRLSSVNLVPLLPYFHQTDFGALEDLGKTFLYPLPLGYILGARWQAKGVLEARARRKGALAGLALGGLLELAQLAVASRSPDLTDAMVCAARPGWGRSWGAAIGPGRSSPMYKSFIRAGWRDRSKSFPRS